MNAIELERSSEIWMVETDEDPDKAHTVDTREWTCSCPDWFYRQRHTRSDCKHLSEVRHQIERRQYWLNRQKLHADKAKSRVAA